MHAKSHILRDPRAEVVIRKEYGSFSLADHRAHPREAEGTRTYPGT